MNVSLEQSQIGIATLVTSIAQLVDAQGRTLEGVEKYAVASIGSRTFSESLAGVGINVQGGTLL